MLNHGAGDILEVFRPGQSQTLLLPFTLKTVPTVDLVAGRIVADPPTETIARPEDDEPDESEG